MATKRCPQCGNDQWTADCHGSGTLHHLTCTGCGLQLHPTRSTTLTTDLQTHE